MSRFVCVLAAYRHHGRGGPWIAMKLAAATAASMSRWRLVHCLCQCPVTACNVTSVVPAVILWDIVHVVNEVSYWKLQLYVLKWPTYTYRPAMTVAFIGFGQESHDAAQTD
jgi:hypothetical protein